MTCKGNVSVSITLSKIDVYTGAVIQPSANHFFRSRLHHHLACNRISRVLQEYISISLCKINDFSPIRDNVRIFQLNFGASVAFPRPPPLGFQGTPLGFQDSPVGFVILVYK